MKQAIRLISLLLREAFSAPRLERRPEPTATMDDSENVLAFHEQGSLTGPLLSIYHFNSLATSRLLPLNGTLLDLGSGSGQYLAYLAQRRPDINIIGLDLSGNMVSLGQQFLATLGLNDRVLLKKGDMTNFSNCLDGEIDLVSSVFSLHHLPTVDDLWRCIREIRKVRENTGCGVWVFDHARPRHPRTPALFPEVFTPDAPSYFREDSANSLRASFSFEELSGVLDEAQMGTFQHHCSRWLRVYQVHWLAPVKVEEILPAALWVENQLPSQTQLNFKGLRVLFPDVPLHRVGEK